MGDVFKEQLVKRINTPKDTAIRVCVWVIVLLIILIVITQVPMVALFVALILGFAASYATGYLNVEYEYVLTNGELDIDVIYDQKKRKRVFNGDMKQFELMAHINDKAHEAAFNTAHEIRDYSSGVTGDNTYAFLATHENKKVKIIIEPNEKMLKAFSKVLTKRNLHLRPSVVLLSK